MRWRRQAALFAVVLVAGVALLVFAHYVGDPTWLKMYLPATLGSDGVLWQVQTTFLSVGFAGLAIAAQLFAEAPLAIGASRGRVLEYVWASWFVGLGLVANALIAVETIWLPSAVGLIGIALLCFVPTVLLLVASSVRLTQLFGHPSRLDEVVRASIVDMLTTRLRQVSRRYADATAGLDDLVTSGWAVGLPSSSTVTLRVPVPQVGRVIRAIKPKPIRQAIALATLPATEEMESVVATAEKYVAPQIVLDVDPGDRTRLGETAFRVLTPKGLDQATNERLIRLLQSSIEFEASEAVTPDEETDREIANLKDAVGTSLRSGALATAERALELLGHVIQGVWIADPQLMDSSRRSSFTRRDWLFRSIGEVEQDVLLSHRAASIFVGAAMSRALEAPKTGSSEYVDECLRSFTRIWSDILRLGGPEFDHLPSRIITCVQNLAAYSYSAAQEHETLQARATWAMGELIKLALDAGTPQVAREAADELGGLFEFDRVGTGRAEVLGVQLVLSGWLLYLSDKGDVRDPGDPGLSAILRPQATRSEILAARSRIEHSSNASFSRWQWWEMKASPSAHAQTLELPHYIDRAELAALAVAPGGWPPVHDQQTASEYSRLIRLLADAERDLTPAEEALQQLLRESVHEWEAAEDSRLAKEPLSEARVDALRVALRDALNEQKRLAAELPIHDDVPADVDVSRPVLGMNVRVPRHYLVDEIFNQTYADPKDLGRMFARAFTEGEDLKIVGALRGTKGHSRRPTASAIRQAIEDLGDDAQYYVLLTPYGGLPDLGEWYSRDFRAVLDRVTHLETGVLDEEAFLFDRRGALHSSRKPEEKDTLRPIEDTTIALGVFEDVHDGDEPQVRIESGEFFVVWAGDQPVIYRFVEDLGVSDQKRVR